MRKLETETMAGCVVVVAGMMAPWYPRSLVTASELSFHHMDCLEFCKQHSDAFASSNSGG